MKRDFIATLENPRGELDTTIATLAMTKALRLMQIASGFIKTVDKKVVNLGVTPKQEVLKQLLEEITPNHKVIIWAVWKENYEQIRKVCESLGLSYTELTGSIPESDRFKNLECFITDPKCRVLIGNPQSAGSSINLVVASYSIIFSRNFSLEHSLQSEARNYRGGSEIHEKITQYNLVCENTIEELVIKALDNKMEISDKVLRSELLLGIKNQK
jgi:non-specific serine/threonine protein kinase